MPNVSEKKKKTLYLWKILMEKTDSDHALTLPQLLEELENMGIAAERKSIYDDIETLRSVGVDIETRKTRNFQYFIEKRTFTLQEIQALAEAVRAAEFIPKGQEAALIKKLGGLCSNYQAEKLNGREPAPAAPEKRKDRSGIKLVLECPETFLGKIEERFGPDFATEPAGKSRLHVTFRTESGTDFLAWLFLQGTEVRLVAPKKLAEQFRERAKAMAKLYKS